MENEKVLKRARLVVKIASVTMLAAIIASLALITSGLQAAAQGGGESLLRGLAMVGAGLAVGLAGIGGGYAVGQAGAAMIAAMTEKPELFGRMFIVLVLGEGIALYGLLMAILLWTTR